MLNTIVLFVIEMYMYKFINIYLPVYKNCLSLYHIKIVRFELKNRSK